MNKAISLKLVVILVSISLLVVSCKSTSQPTQVAESVSNPVVYLSFSGIEKRILFEEQIGQNNCNGTEIASSSVGRERSIIFNLEMSGEIIADATGKIGVAPIGEIELGMEVARKFGVTYGQEERLSRSMTVSARVGTNMLHTIQQFEIWEIGEATIKVGSQTVKVPFKFRRDFGIDLIASDNIGCPTHTPIAAEQEKLATSTPYPPLTSTPTPTGPTATLTPTATLALTPTPTLEPSPTPDLRLQLGETWQEEGVWITLSDVDFRSDGEIRLTLILENKTGDMISFAWHEDNLKLVDNLGNEYDAIHNGGATPKGEAVLTSGQKYSFACWNCTNLRFRNRDNVWFQQSVTEIVFSISDVSRVSKAMWRITVPH